MRRVLCAFGLVACLTLPAAAQELPHFPKAGPPQPLPEPACDTTRPDGGDWLLGRWVAPETRFEFTRSGSGVSWTMSRKSVADEFGWRDGTTISGQAEAVTACTLRLTAGEGAFTFNGVLTEEGRIYGYAANTKGQHVRFVLRRER